MNLNKLNVTELNAQEMKTTDGGILPVIAVAVAVVYVASTVHGLANGKKFNGQP
ncbi:class IIb bacteriocin, lactobin A/cerein 7B family [Capnocytophaga sp. ARDL2]|uniref:class IIb bacteriocin, lactobin A/cerein 7B family n=1 Tax=Capnocytophaga sp. ARDL2 TaxID=3238809 RepID=UPI003558CF20